MQFFYECYEKLKKSRFIDDSITISIRKYGSVTQGCIIGPDFVFELLLGLLIAMLRQDGVLFPRLVHLIKGTPLQGILYLQIPWNFSSFSIIL